MKFEINRLSYALGAEVTGLDLREPLDAQIIEYLRQAWAEHLVLVFRDQNLTPDQHMRFSKYFGEPIEFPENSLAYPGYPEIFVLTTHHADGSLADTRRIAANWHMDLTFTKAPALGSVLSCLRMPRVGGTTIFSNAHLAYQKLSPTFAAMLRNLYVAHSTAKTAYRRNSSGGVKEEAPPVAHKLVQTHPVNGRECLVVSESTSLNVVGMSDEESRTILQFLFDHVTKVEFTHRHYWNEGDILMWDNRAAIHMAVADNRYEQVRLLHRVTLKGPETGRLAQDVAKEVDALAERAPDARMQPN